MKTTITKGGLMMPRRSFLMGTAAAAGATLAAPSIVRAQSNCSISTRGGRMARSGDGEPV